MNTMMNTLALAAMLAVPLSVQAQASAEGKLSNFSYTLVDLLPDDGIAPSLSIVRPQHALSSSAYVRGDIEQTGARRAFDSNADRTTRLYSRELDASLAKERGAVIATIGGDSFQQLVFNAAAATTGSVGYDRQAGAWSEIVIDEFVLSPGTQVTFFADVDASVSTSLPQTGAARERATVSAVMDLKNVIATRYPGSPHKVELTAPAWSSDPNLPFSESASERLWLLYRNTGSTPQSLKLAVTLHATAGSIVTSTPTTPVPEPATAAMLLAGLGMVAGALRRKRGEAKESV